MFTNSKQTKNLKMCFHSHFSLIKNILVLFILLVVFFMFLYTKIYGSDNSIPFDKNDQKKNSFLLRDKIGLIATEQNLITNNVQQQPLYRGIYSN